MEQEEGHAEDRGGVATPVVAPSPWDPASFDLLPVGVALWDADARLEHANPVLCDLLGAPLERLRRTDLLDVVLAEDRSTTAVAVAELLGGELNAANCRLRGAGLGDERRIVPWPLRMDLTVFFGPDGRPAGLIGHVFDFAAAQSGPLLPLGLAQVLEDGADFLLVIEANGLVSYGNRAARDALGVGAHARVPTAWWTSSSRTGWPRSRTRSNRRCWPWACGRASCRSGTGSCSRCRCRRGSCPTGCAPVRRPTRSWERSRCSLRDITELKHAEQRLRQLATHDYLTGLPNRLLLYDRLELALNRYSRYGSPVALMFCDLDGFKPVNDEYGHQVGDAVLVQVADRIHSIVRDTDTAARVGGDEFALLVEGVEDIELLTGVADRLVARVAEPIVVGRVTAQVGVSIGLVVASERCHQVDTLVALADSAMYQAKASGRGRYVVITGDDL